MSKQVAIVDDALLEIARLQRTNRMLLAALKNYVAACYKQDINLGPITGAAEAAITIAERRTK